MQILEAINELKQAIGMACDAQAQGGTGRGEVGDSIGGSIVDIKPHIKPVAADDSIVEIGKDFKPEAVTGGVVEIRFSDPKESPSLSEPEAARTLDSVFSRVLRDLDINHGDNSAIKKRVGKTIRRIIKFYVPDDKAGDFVAHALDVARKIRETPTLLTQFRVATELSLDYINDIRGAKSYVNLVLGKGVEFDGDEHEVKPPHFALEVKGVPIPLAKKLVGITGQKLKDMPLSGTQPSRDHLSFFDNGGVTFTVAMDDPKIGDVMAQIETYVKAMRQFRPGAGGIDGGVSQ